jgi:hypothetical protein
MNAAWLRVLQSAAVVATQAFSHAVLLTLRSGLPRKGEYRDGVLAAAALDD